MAGVCDGAVADGWRQQEQRLGVVWPQKPSSGEDSTDNSPHLQQLDTQQQAVAVTYPPSLSFQPPPTPQPHTHSLNSTLSIQAMPPKPVPKLPIKLLTNPSVGGALHAIALKLFDIRRARGLKAIEWQNPGRRKEVKRVVGFWGCYNCCWRGREVLGA